MGVQAARDHGQEPGKRGAGGIGGQRGTKETPTRLRVGMEVVRTPQTIYGTDDGGKNIHRPMRGIVEYIHPRGNFHIVAFEVCGKIIKESFQGVAV